MAPDADVTTKSGVKFDVGKIGAGQTVTLDWNGRPVSLFRRTSADIASLLAAPEQNARPERPDETDEPDYAKGRFRSLRPELFVFVAVCTRERCVVDRDDGAVTKIRGFACPCCGTRYDLAGRVYEGPAPLNLHVPRYSFLKDGALALPES